MDTIDLGFQQDLCLYLKGFELANIIFSDCLCGLDIYSRARFMLHGYVKRVTTRWRCTAAVSSQCLCYTPFVSMQWPSAFFDITTFSWKESSDLKHQRMLSWEGCTPHPLLMLYSPMPTYSDTQKLLMKNICVPTFLTLLKVMDL